MTVLLIAGAAISVGVLLALAILQDRVIARQKQALEIQARATSREHARAELLASELHHLERTAAVLTLWRSRQVRAS